MNSLLTIGNSRSSTVMKEIRKFVTTKSPINPLVFVDFLIPGGISKTFLALATSISPSNNFNFKSA